MACVRSSRSQAVAGDVVLTRLRQSAASCSRWRCALACSLVDLCRTTNQSPWFVRLNSANEPASAVRCFVSWAGRTHVALSHTSASFSPDASLEVFAPSARSNRDALSDAAKRSDDPASALFAPSRPARPRTFATVISRRLHERSGVALAVFRLANVNAVMLGVGLVARLCVASKRRFKRLATCLRSTVPAVSGVTGPIAITSDPSHQALPHYIGRSRAIMHRRVP